MYTIKMFEGKTNQAYQIYQNAVSVSTIKVLRYCYQMDPASKIEDYLYLGSEWNASNLEELGHNGISHILNVTREIDNFFPGNFRYLNIRVYDEEATDLVRLFYLIRQFQ